MKRECHHNAQCMWPLARLAPDYKTLAEFRRGNLQALVSTSAAFVQLARTQCLIAPTTVAIDGCKVQAVASSKAIVGPRRAWHKKPSAMPSRWTDTSPYSKNRTGRRRQRLGIRVCKALAQLQANSEATAG